MINVGNIFSNFLNEAMTLRDISVKELARMMNVERARIHAWLEGKNFPITETHYAQLEKHFGFPFGLFYSITKYESPIVFVVELLSKLDPLELLLMSRYFSIEDIFALSDASREVIKQRIAKDDS